MRTLDAKRIEELNKLYFGNQSLEVSEEEKLEKIKKQNRPKTNDFITVWQVEKQEKNK